MVLHLTDLPGSVRPKPRETGSLSFPIWSCSARGLPCRGCHHPRGELLPHLFTLTRTRRAGRRRYVFCGTFPGIAPGGRYPPRCPVESGLSSTHVTGHDHVLYWGGHQSRRKDRRSTGKTPPMGWRLTRTSHHLPAAAPYVAPWTASEPAIRSSTCRSTHRFAALVGSPTLPCQATTYGTSRRRLVRNAG